MISVYTLFFSYLSLLNHNHFNTNAFDLGIFDYAAWNNLHGNFFAGLFIGLPSLFAIHFQPILLPLGLVYLIWDDARALLLIQSLVLAVGAVPLYWLARQQLNAWLGLVFAAVYLLFPALQGANLFEFHPITLAAGLLPFAYWYLRQGHFGRFVLFSLLAAACQEDVFLIVGMLGCYLFITRRDWRGLAVGAGGFAGFLFLTIVFIPHFSGGETHFGLHRYQALGQTIPEVLETVLTHPLFVWNYIWSNPDKARYLTHLLAPVAYLSLLDPLTLLIAAPTIAINLLSSLPTSYALDRFHYSAMLVPFVLASAINGTAFLIDLAHQKRNFSKSFLYAIFMVMILITSLSYQFKFGHSLLSLGFQWPANEARHRTAYQMLQLVPTQAVISAQTNLSTHLTHRPGIYLFPQLSSDKYGSAEFIVLNLSGNIYPIFDPANYKRRVAELKDSGDYTVVFEQDDYLLLRKN
ncbi:MAG: DUF2079 domain-containing protein [Chloroflexi bacterium]|nr:DUF2079 domain-containing protein [Chloroflexota bacterium]